RLAPILPRAHQPDSDAVFIGIGVELRVLPKTADVGLVGKIDGNLRLVADRMQRHVSISLCPDGLPRRCLWSIGTPKGVTWRASTQILTSSPLIPTVKAVQVAALGFAFSTRRWARRRCSQSHSKDANPWYRAR